jgi:glycosyltransferase involved in cell wall biosynthesis
VVHPPIDVDYWTPDPNIEREDFFLYAGRLVSYKRPDLAIAAAKESGSRLDIAGAGPEVNRLRAMAGPTVRFIESPSRDELRDLYRRARALVFPGIEDFGMTLVEAQACGTPVIARAAGGALESVVDGRTGHLYADASPSGLAAVMNGWQVSRFQTDEIRANALRFSKERFAEEISDVVRTAVA